jgi:hypothetical protein
MVQRIHSVESKQAKNGTVPTLLPLLLTMDVTEVIEHYGNVIVTANVDGKYDKRGMPDPLVLAFYFTPHGDRIVQLIILRNRFDI